MLAMALRHVRDKQPLLEAGAQAVLSRAQGAFSDPGLRPSPWPARKRGNNPLLRLSGTLAQSIRVVSATNESAIVGTDRPYAVWHQKGTKPYVIRPKNSKGGLFFPGAPHPLKKVNHPGLPARPFFPVRGRRLTPDAQADVRNAIARTLAGKLGLDRDAFL